MMWSRMMMTAALAAGLAVAVAPAAAQSPEQVNYQGLLSDANGNPLASANYRLDFSIYDSATGGTLIWGPYSFDAATGNGHAPQVAVVNGRFNVILGPKDTTGRDISSAFLSAGTRFVEIKVSNGTAISPRQQFLSSPYAYAVKGITFNAAGYVVPSGIAMNTTFDPQTVITARAVPADQSDRTTAQGSTEMNELILYQGNDPYNGAGPDYITLRAPAIRLQTYNDAAIGDIAAKGGSNTRLYIAPDGKIGIGTVDPQATLDVRGGISLTGSMNVNGEKPLLAQYFSINSSGQVSTGYAVNTYTCWVGGTFSHVQDFAFNQYAGDSWATTYNNNGTWWVVLGEPRTFADRSVFVMCARNEFTNRKSSY